MINMSVDQALREANAHCKNGDYEAAKCLYRAVLKAYPKNARAKKGLEGLGNDTSLNVKNELPDGMVSQLIGLTNSGQFSLASRMAEELIKTYPDALIIWNILGAANQGREYYADALDAFEKVVKIDPSLAEGHNNMGVVLHKLGRLDSAAAALSEALHLKPDYCSAYFNMGNVLKEQGQLDESIEYYKKALSLKPGFVAALNNLGIVFTKQGKLQAAIGIYEQALEIEPSSSELYNNLGTAQKDNGQRDRAIGSYKKALSLNPSYADAYHNLGNALKEQGKLHEAIEAFEKALCLDPASVDVLRNNGGILKECGRLDEAIKYFQKALALNPNCSDTLNDIGNVLREQGRYRDAVQTYDRALALQIRSEELYNNKGLALKELGMLDEAIACYRKALSINPDYFISLNNLGNALKEKLDFEAAVEAFNKALLIHPSSADTFNNLGGTFRAIGNLNEAIKCYQKALLLCPEQSDTYNSLGHALNDLGRLDEAIEAYKNALSVNPKHAVARATKIHRQAHICDWSDLETDKAHSMNVGVVDEPAPPFAYFSMEDVPDRHLKRSQNYSKHRISSTLRTRVFNLGQKPDRLRIGYLSSDFHDHPVARGIAKVIETHNREKFEIFGYSLGQPSDDAVRKRLSTAFDRFVDFHRTPDTQVLDKLRNDNINIAIDLTGYTSNGRSNIFSHRVAPIQISYLGYPGSMGSDDIDYIIADKTLIPANCQRYYSEKPIYLANHCQPQDDSAEIGEIQSRSDLNLPDQGFVFCAINSCNKITPREFDIWMRLLKKVHGSVLWLFEANKWAKENLIKEAAKRGVESHRLIFAKRKPHHQYLAQFCQADLFLDTFNYNAGATAGNALWAGLPVLTKQGKSYTARMASSLLNSIGLSELITTNEEEYEILALDFAENPTQISKIKQKLRANLLTMPLFNTQALTKQLEVGFDRAYENYLEGKEPRVIEASEL